MGDYGILISDKDSNVNKLENVLFTTKYVTAKLDTTKDISFVDITFTFLNDPPEPPGLEILQLTEVYSLPHGYNYVPSFWSLVTVVLPPASSFYQSYFQDAGVISTNSSDDEASFYIDCDDENINFNVRKFNDGGTPNDLTGAVLKVRLYVFAEDING